jgi:hypothetical protein
VIEVGIVGMQALVLLGDALVEHMARPRVEEK